MLQSKDKSCQTCLLLDSFSTPFSINFGMPCRYNVTMEGMRAISVANEQLLFYK